MTAKQPRKNLKDKNIQNKRSNVYLDNGPDFQKNAVGKSGQSNSSGLKSNSDLTELEKYFVNTNAKYLWDNRAMYKIFTNLYSKDSMIYVLDKRLGFSLNNLP